MTDRTDTAVATRDQGPAASAAHPSVAWLEHEFPGWTISIGASSGWDRDEPRALWIARRRGHHPQAELSAAKLHTRLTDYLDREARRRELGT
ncbi:MAG: hypothetical protein WEB09_11710 [Nitriliruptor sp.]